MIAMISAGVDVAVAVVAPKRAWCAVSNPVCKASITMVVIVQSFSQFLSIFGLSSFGF